MNQNEPGILHLEALVSEPPSVERSRAKALNDHIGQAD
jgi:hypothetical protein